VEVVELAHQALIEHWPRLRDWLEQDRAFLAWRAQTDQQRERWESAGRDDGALLRGSALVAAGEWVPARDAEVAAPTREFVGRSVARQRRDVPRVRVVVAVLAVLALAAGTLAVTSEQRGNRNLQPDNSSIKVDDGVWLQRRAPDGGWTTSRLELPSLRTVRTSPVPPGPAPGGIATVGDGDSGAPQD
jgi:hypothetical protein